MRPQGKQTHGEKGGDYVGNPSSRRSAYIVVAKTLGQQLVTCPIVFPSLLCQGFLSLHPQSVVGVPPSSDVIVLLHILVSEKQFI